MVLQKLIFGRYLDKDERVLYAVHKHWVHVFKGVLEVAVFGFLIPWFLYFIGFDTPLFFWLAVVWSGGAYLHFLYQLFDWYSDVWLITNMSIVVIDWNGFFNSQATRVGYEDVEGVGYEIVGFWATVLRYGTLTLKVMSNANYVLKAASAPKKAELAIAHSQREYIDEREHKDASNIKSLLSDMIARHMRQKIQ